MYLLEGVASKLDGLYSFFDPHALLGSEFLQKRSGRHDVFVVRALCSSLPTSQS
jgi:hypothetical protein